MLNYLSIYVKYIYMLSMINWLYIDIIIWEFSVIDLSMYVYVK